MFVSEKARALARLSLAGAALLCAASPASAADSAANLGVSAEVVNKCSVQTTPLTFGEVNVVSMDHINADALLLVTCTAGVAWSVAPITADDMLNGTQKLRFAIFDGPSRMNRWDVPLTGTGNGSQQINILYGRVKGNQYTLPAGDYSTTVVLTLTY